MRILSYAETTHINGGFDLSTKKALEIAGTTMVIDLLLTLPFQYYGNLDSYVDKHVLSHVSKISGILVAALIWL